jgi:hypothetical protein
MSNDELIEKLRQVDEVTLIELLDIDSDNIVDAFLDQIEDNQNTLRRYLDENE